MPAHGTALGHWFYGGHMLVINIKHDIERSVAWCDEAQKRHIPFATVLTLTRTGQDVLQAEKKAISTEFDRPTRWTLNAPRLYSATLNKSKTSYMKAEVEMRDQVGGYAGYLHPQIHGGTRQLKSFEKALQRIGLMPQGWVAVPGTRQQRDVYGNVPGNFIVQLLSYFSAFGEQGYRANMTDKRRTKLAKRGKTEQGHLTINGVEYFISHGKGNRFGRRSWINGRDQHLPAGIWARRGTHGSDTWAVFLFVPRARYKPRLHFFQTAERTTSERFDINWRAAWAQVQATANTRGAWAGTKPWDGGPRRRSG
jgi:hypothetical protein